MESKFTKGKWNVGKYEQGLTIYGGGGSNKIAIVATDLYSAEQKANAELIAAAPDLLNACIKMIDYYENGKVSSGISYIEEAINKAIKL